MNKTIVLSGINLVDGGAYSIYTDCLDEIVNSNLDKENKIIALVSKKSLFTKYSGSQIEFIEFPKSKKSWLYRIYYEYIFFNKLSKKLNPDVWLSLHDITPNVHTKRQYVYCHNPSPFYNMKFSEIKYGWKYYMFSKFYKYLYRINIYKNTEVIVQQRWLKEEFKRMFKLNNIVVARPSLRDIRKPNENLKKEIQMGRKATVTFVYPSYPRPYKNFELLCEAAKRLSNSGIKFNVYITLAGNENRYSKMLYAKYGDVNGIKFVGLMSRDELYKLYAKSDCLVFTSKLETLGMPIIEYKLFNKAMILAELPYAHETVGDYDKVLFTPINDVDLMICNMKKIIDGNYQENNFSKIKYDNEPDYENWNELLNYLIS